MKHRVLVVEDNQLNSELLRDWLEVEGYEAIVAADLNEAFAFLEKHKPDAVLLDVQLGSDDGLAVVLRIRHEPLLRDIPVIAVTAQVTLFEQQRILESGCNSVVSKPVDFKVLLEQLQLWFSRV
jgi:CheY-like chemotaxis protein